jgi:hypothetical protein
MWAKRRLAHSQNPLISQPTVTHRHKSDAERRIMTRWERGEQAMDCCAMMTQALLSMPDIDPDDFVFGQLLGLTAGLSLALIARLSAMLLFGW